MLDVQADITSYKRFDNFNSKYSPAGSSLMKQVFLNHEKNDINGKYLAEIKLICGMANICQGSRVGGWSGIASWVLDNDLH